MLGIRKHNQDMFIFIVYSEMDKGNGLPDEYIDQAYSYIPNTNPNISLPLKKKKIRQYVITNSDIFIERELDYECGMTLEDIIDPDYNGEEEPEIQYFFDPPNCIVTGKQIGRAHV